MSQENLLFDVVFCFESKDVVAPFLSSIQYSTPSMFSSFHVTAASVDARFAFITFSDHSSDDPFRTTKVYPFTSNVGKIQSHLGEIILACLVPTAASKEPSEALVDFLFEAHILRYRPAAMKIVVVIADMPPRSVCQGLHASIGHDGLILARKLAKLGVAVYTAGIEPAMGEWLLGRDFFEGVGLITGGRYVGVYGVTHMIPVLSGVFQEYQSLRCLRRLCESLVTSQSAELDEAVVASVYKAVLDAGLSIQRVEVKIDGADPLADGLAAVAFADRARIIASSSDVEEARQRLAPYIRDWELRAVLREAPAPGTKSRPHSPHTSTLSHTPTPTRRPTTMTSYPSASQTPGQLVQTEDPARDRERAAVEVLLAADMAYVGDLSAPHTEAVPQAHEGPSQTPKKGSLGRRRTLTGDPNSLTPLAEETDYAHQSGNSRHRRSCSEHERPATAQGSYTSASQSVSVPTEAGTANKNRRRGLWSSWFGGGKGSKAPVATPAPPSAVTSIPPLSVNSTEETRRTARSVWAQMATFGLARRASATTTTTTTTAAKPRSSSLHTSPIADPTPDPSPFSSEGSGERSGPTESSGDLVVHVVDGSPARHHLDRHKRGSPSRHTRHRRQRHHSEANTSDSSPSHDERDGVRDASPSHWPQATPRTQSGPVTNEVHAYDSAYASRSGYLTGSATGLTEPAAHHTRSVSMPDSLHLATSFSDHNYHTTTTTTTNRHPNVSHDWGTATPRSNSLHDWSLRSLSRSSRSQESPKPPQISVGVGLYAPTQLDVASWLRGTSPFP